MATHHDTSGEPLAAAKMVVGETPGGSSTYVPMATGKNSPQFSVVFSMKEEKCALLKVLELCKVS